MQVSDGQRRRVQILMTLLKPFEVLLLDELSGAQTIRKRDSSHAVCDILLISQSPDRSS